EVVHSVGLDGYVSLSDVNRFPDGTSAVKRVASPTEPAPRDPQHVRQRQEEQQTVLAMLPTYNSVHGTTYDLVYPDPDDRDKDMIIESSDGKWPKLFVQIVVGSMARTVCCSSCLWRTCWGSLGA